MSPGPLKLGVAIGAYSAGVPGARDVADFARTAEAVGFDSVQVGDHIQWHQPILEATVLMATFAAATSRIRIASDVVILPLRDPVLIAKTVASLDVLSGGRMIFGVGVGGDHPAEYAAMRVPLRERGARTNEGLEIVRGLFTTERFSYAGRHFSIDDVAIEAEAAPLSTAPPTRPMRCSTPNSRRSRTMSESKPSSWMPGPTRNSTC